MRDRYGRPLAPTRTGRNGTTQHPCPKCGQQFWFATRKPSPDWRCAYCTPRPPEVSDELGAHQYEMENR